MDKLKLDEEVEEDKEEAAKEVIRNYKTLSEMNDPGVFVLPILSLQHNEWIPSYTDNSTRKVESDEVWHVKCNIMDPYGNEYNQGYQTKTTERVWSRVWLIGSHINGIGAVSAVLSVVPAAAAGI
nr:hypothetical protein [Tanacetum cinerariifolium]